MQLITAKLTRPGHVETMIHRPRLYDALAGWRAARAVLIHAPAGYGKSSLVNRWADEFVQDSRVAWLNLDERDTDPARFVRYLVAALEPLRPGLRELVKPLLYDTQGSPSRVLDALLHGLDDLAPPEAPDPHLLLVLDDLHRAQSPAVNSLLATMLDFGPETLHFMLLARWAGELPLARLYAQEKLVTLTSDDLRFSERESAAYLTAKGIQHLTADHLGHIVDRSEGWIAALQLAVLSLKKPGNPDELVAVLQGDRGWLAEFLSSEVLNRQPPELRRFLLQTSILDEFNASLAAAVTGDSASHARIAALKRGDIFLIQLDSRGEWFRYHHLFQELLQRRLIEQTEPAALARLHQRAAAWWTAEEQVAPAVHHLLAAGDEDQAADLVAMQLQTTLLQAPYVARQLFGLLPAAVIERRPRLLLDRCFLATVFNDSETPSVVEWGETVLADYATAGALDAGLEGEFRIVQCGVAYARREFDTVRRLLDHVRPVTARLSSHFAGSYAFLQMLMSFHAGEHAAGEGYGAQALRTFESVGFALGTVALQREMANWSMIRGRGEEATCRFRKLLNSRQHRSPLYNRDTIFANLCAAENSYLLQQNEAAFAYLRNALTLAEELQEKEFIYLTQRMGNFYALGARREDWRHTSDLLATPVKSPIPTRLFMEIEIRRLIAAGNPSGAWAIVEQFGSRLPYAIDRPHADLLHDIDGDFPFGYLTAYLLAYIGRSQALDDVSSLLAEATAQAQKTGMRLHALRLLAVTAWQQLLLHGREAARAPMETALELAQETGYVRVLLDIPALEAIMDETGEAFSIVRTATPFTVYTGREREILQLLPTNLTYAQIGAQLNISLNTVRSHIRNLYRKLDVHERSEAVRAVRQDGLID